MTIKLQIMLIICVIVFFVIIIRMLKKDVLELKYTILWIITGVVLLLMAIFPSIMDWITRVVGIYSVTNALFAVALLFTLMMLLSITSIVSRLTNKNKEIAQRCSLLEKEIQDIKSSKE